ncbi:hypothetical protein [Paenibacillus aestuarii]|uniref:Uncharacterized protein n=1 Tax=Paenibacillus aestuarii TaxID=516965 RepID=A0ABW0KIF2_9BACL|nr:hypothetical protein [Paenibacillus aestuarii]
MKIVELQGTEGSAPAIERRQGFEEVLSQNMEIRVIAHTAKRDISTRKY